MISFPSYLLHVHVSCTLSLPLSFSIYLDLHFAILAGNLVLCLDNSSTMALVQLELLNQIERATGKKITELFQWIVASGLGGLLMLVMVYGKHLL